MAVWKIKKQKQIQTISSVGQLSHPGEGGGDTRDESAEIPFSLFCGRPSLAFQSSEEAITKWSERLHAAQFRSVQDGIYAFRKVHMCSTLSLISFPCNAFDTVLLLVWLTIQFHCWSDWWYSSTVGLTDETVPLWSDGWYSSTVGLTDDTVPLMVWRTIQFHCWSDWRWPFLVFSRASVSSF